MGGVTAGLAGGIQPPLGRLDHGSAVVQPRVVTARLGVECGAMSAKRVIMLGMIVGSTIGSWIPTLWGAGWFSFSSVLGSMVGGLAGIWLGYRLSR